MAETYSLEHVKKAFWEIFHKSGEVWFDYLGTDEECTKSTNNIWEDFETSLRKSKP